MKVVITKPIGANERSTGNKVIIECSKPERTTIIECAEVIPDSIQNITESSVKLTVEATGYKQTEHKMIITDKEKEIIIQCAGKVKVDKEFRKGQVTITPDIPVLIPLKKKVTKKAQIRNDSSNESGIK